MRGDVLKTWLYAALVVCLGAWLAPWVYNAGKALAEISGRHYMNLPLTWLARASHEASFRGFYNVSLAIAAAVLFLPFLSMLHGGRRPMGKRVWSMRLPEGARELVAGQPLVTNPNAWQQAIVGFVVALILFGAVAAVASFAMEVEWKPPGEAFSRTVLEALMLSIAGAVIQEVAFRGAALGIFLRAFRPSIALAVGAAFYALVMFSVAPAGMAVTDPEASNAGFELVRELALRLSEPRELLGSFGALLALGGVLGYARLRTASLWLPAGLHTGILLASALLPKLTTGSTGFGMNPSPGQGLIALAGILAAGFLTARFTSDAPDRTT